MYTVQLVYYRLKQQWDGYTLWGPPPPFVTPLQHKNSNMLLARLGGNMIRYSLLKLTKFVIYWVEGPYASRTTDSVLVDKLCDKGNLTSSTAVVQKLYIIHFSLQENYFRRYNHSSGEACWNPMMNNFFDDIFLHHLISFPLSLSYLYFPPSFHH
jgi:hypothetical protein